MVSTRFHRRDLLAGSAAIGTAAALASVRSLQAAPRADRSIWDNHCHLSSFPGATPAARLKRLLQVADRFGIERVVCFMGWPFATDPTPAELIRQNRQVADAIKTAPTRALGYVYVNPNHLRTSLEQMERWIADGPMVGIKLWVAARCSDRKLDPIIEKATELKAVVYQHTWIKTGGNMAGESTPIDLAILAQRHPEARLICGHSGGNWELGIRAVRAHPNISVEIAGSDPTSGITEMAVREVGAERVIYGSDAGGRSFASQLAKVHGAELSEDARAKILGANLRRLLQSVLQAKS